jgi:hypothetical protein
VDVTAQAKSGPNPFVSNRVDSAWDVDAVDVETINRTAFERCRETIELVRRTDQCRGLLLTGEPGSGKTHLLQRLRREVQRLGRDCFVYVPPVSGPDRFFRDLLQHTVRDLVGTRTGGPTSQLEAVLVRELLKAETQQRVTPALLWSDVRGRHAPGVALFRWLEGPMALLCERLELDPETARVLRHYLAEHHRSDAYAWLLGRAVSDAALERLEVGRSLEEDADAFQALVTLSRLAGAHAVLVLAFDQLEGLQVRPDDRDGLLAFASGIARLFVECRNVATVSCVQTHFKQDLEQAVPPAHMHRLAQDQGALTLLNRSAALELVRRRLAAASELAEERERLGVHDPLWPLAQGDLESAIPAGGIPARLLLNHCRDRFEAWRQGATPRAPAVAVDDALVGLWEARLAQVSGEASDEGVMADGLLKVLDARAPGRAKRGAQRDIDLVIAGAHGEVGVAICHAQSMRSLAARLKRLQTLAASGRFQRLVVLRDERLPVSASAKTCRERLAALESSGHAFLRPSEEAYAAIAAARTLLAEAAAGDLSVDGAPLAPEALKHWLAGHLDANTTALLDALDAPGSSASDETLSRIQEALAGRWMVPAADLARLLEIDEDALLRPIRSPQRLVGLLAGPPAVVFLRPEALERD